MSRGSSGLNRVQAVTVSNRRRSRQVSGVQIHAGSFNFGDPSRSPNLTPVVAVCAVFLTLLFVFFFLFFCCLLIFCARWCSERSGSTRDETTV